MLVDNSGNRWEIKGGSFNSRSSFNDRQRRRVNFFLGRVLTVWRTNIFFYVQHSCSLSWCIDTAPIYYTLSIESSGAELLPLVRWRLTLTQGACQWITTDANRHRPPVWIIEKIKRYYKFWVSLPVCGNIHTEHVLVRSGKGSGEPAAGGGGGRAKGLGEPYVVSSHRPVTDCNFQDSTPIKLKYFNRTVASLQTPWASPHPPSYLSLKVTPEKTYTSCGRP